MNRIRRHLMAGLASGIITGCAGGLPQRSLAGRRVIVIGAGFAGLSAACALRQSGAEVIVVEARSRPGGRVMTDRSLGFPVDLGPSWLHGGLGNPLKPIAKNADIATRVTDYSNVRFTNFSSGQRRVMAPAQLLGYARRIDDSMKSASLQVRMRARLLFSGDKLSVADVLGEAIRDAQRQDGAIDGAALALEQWVLESNLAAPLNEVGARALLDTSATSEDDEVLPIDDRYLVAGMDRLVSLLARDLDIRYGVTVRHVEWKPGSVRVSSSGGEWEADSVVVTLPVGVLLGGDVRFEPPLPDSFTGSLGRLRMGLLNKVCLTFSETFWDETLDFLANYSDPPPLCYAWLNLTRYNGAPALIGFTSGNAARLVETMSDDEVVANVMQQIRTHAGGATAPASGRIPDPVQVRISRWGSDPLARGSYSFLALGGSGGDRDRLAVPVGNTLFFAGEATHRNDPASVHGAWWSGQRAARQIQTVA